MLLRTKQNRIGVGAETSSIIRCESIDEIFAMSSIWASPIATIHA